MRSISISFYILVSILFYRMTPSYENNSRTVSSIFGMSCLDHANAIILNKSWYNKSFNTLMRERIDLQDYYKNFKSSIDDFEKVKTQALRSKVKLLKDGETSLAAKIALIRKAKSTLDISYYIFSDDEVGNIILNEIRKAVARGVHVRVLIDSTSILNASLFSNQFKSLLKFRGPRGIDGTKRMGKAEVVAFNELFSPRKTVRKYVDMAKNLFRDADNQIPVNDSTVNRRLHDKIILMDAEDPNNSLAIIGGRNIANEYHTLDSFRGESFEFEDMDVLIKDTKDISIRTERSSLTGRIQDYYDKLFYHIGNSHMANAIVRLTRSAYRKEIGKMSRISRKTFKRNPQFNAKLNNMIEGDFFEEGFDSGLVRIVNELQNIHSPWGRIKYEKIADLNPNSITNEIWSNMQKSQHTIDIVTPYAHFTDKEVNFIKLWLKENPNRRFRLVTSSLATNDTIASQSLIDYNLIPKLTDDPNISKAQLEIHYYGKENDTTLGGDINYGKLHAKYAVFDNERSIVMTSNLDPRSRSLNSEIGVSIDQSAKSSNIISKELTEKTEDLIGRSHQHNSREWQRINNSDALKWKRLASRLIHIIVNLFNLERNI
ncbi:phospholipase D-like domain-containing protein [Halobacteriovorax sp. HLS]|uniref:phospholipase D-like domain-containing protein n=1 Tax=Halobacteriovorax sp. HLS TaxID=2234000 RepID=UPI000FD8D142|nr:phospholipase D-like domain-containing protein [Halobacteriovorax sp. HLS]